jgi:HD domain protein
MNQNISLTIDFVKKTLEGAETGHDWFHTERVWRLARLIAKTENCNQEIVEISALLHDIADPKFHNGDETLALEISEKFLNEIGMEAQKIEQILFIIKHISFKNKGETIEKTKELEIVQDADRLDAMGAIGISRTFNFGGYKNNPIYNPDIQPNIHQTKEEYKKSNGTTINHFYEKLLLLKNLMNTDKGRELAEERHSFMLVFLEQFYKEWDSGLDV